MAAEKQKKGLSLSLSTYISIYLSICLSIYLSRSLSFQGAELMGSGRRGRRERNPNAGAFFVATLLLWVVSVVFEIMFNRRTELLPVVGGFCFFQASNWVIRFALSTDPLFVNTAVSLLHSTITSLSVVSILINEWMNNSLSVMFDHSRLFSSTWPGAYTALCFSCGYFAYDQWDMLRYRLYSGCIPSILVHHLVLLVCFTLALFRNVTINYLILTLVCEVLIIPQMMNCSVHCLAISHPRGSPFYVIACIDDQLHSIFLHVRKVRRMAGVRDTKTNIVRAEWVANWAAFFIARLACHILITYKLIRDAPKFGNGVELPLALLGMVGMNVLNVFLGLDLFKAYRREKNGPPNHQE